MSKRVYKVKCRICGKIFEGGSANASVCQECRENGNYKKVRSEERRKLWAENHPPIEFKPVKCLRCGKEFIPKNSINRFCSDCRRDHPYDIRPDVIEKRGSYRKPASNNHICKVCGKEFSSGLKSADYCVECAQKGRYLRSLYINRCRKIGRKPISIEKFKELYPKILDIPGTVGGDDIIDLISKYYGYKDINVAPLNEMVRRATIRGLSYGQYVSNVSKPIKCRKCGQIFYTESSEIKLCHSCRAEPSHYKLND